MSLVGIIDLIGLLAGLLALIVVFIGRKRFFNPGTRFLLLILFVLIVFFSLSNFLEWGNITRSWDIIEDYLRVLEPMFWWGIVYTILMRQQLDEQIKMREALSQSNTELEKALTKAKRSKELEEANKKLAQAQTYIERAYDEVNESHQKQKGLNEQLKLSNEETLSLNEELIATNEALSAKKDELEHAMHQLKEAQAQLIQSEKMASMGVLTAGVAHELNNPLNFIKGSASAIRMTSNANNSKELASLLDNIDEGVKRAIEIIQSLNHFNRQNDDDINDCDVHKIIDNCLVILGSSLRYRVKVEKNYSSSGVEVSCNEGKIHQLFLNVLTNAIQSIDKDGEIIIKTEVKADKIEVVISDNGCGISQENLPKIMDPFFTTKPAGEGTGLGLSLVYAIIKEHRGKIKYQSEEGVGTSAIISLPLSKN
ncbi:ATP-binding protein [Carboxylicivirga sp. N1Y90]|uniref:sensor histidine kinase n=1 Tax=Carboxylicivirga fragile TaxID=3417571 RepID=UPI003D346825|nr:GHKL domain-containing protein [Marinilabiliaceae bacterium N1Y90]